MKVTTIEFLQMSFGNDKTKIKQYLIDEEIDFVLVKEEKIISEEFYSNIDKFIPNQFSDLEQQFGTQG